MVDPKKQDFWPNINTLKGNHYILRIRGVPVHQKLGMILENKVVQKLKFEICFYKKRSPYRKCISTIAASARTRRSLGHHLLHPLILRLLVLCAPAVLRPRALQDAPAPSDPNS